MLPTKKKVELTLTHMGSTGSEIAAFLEGQGIHGIRQDSDQCPLALYLSSCFGVRTAVCEDEIFCADDTRSLTMTPPKAVRTFIINFDLGRYPGLALQHPGRRKEKTKKTLPRP